MANCTHLLVGLRSPFFLLCLTLLVAADGGPKRAVPVAEPGCPTRCGAVDIPYPFGIGERCAINSGFALRCNSGADGDRTPVIGGNLQLQMTRISVVDSKVWVRCLISAKCYNPANGKTWYHTPISLNMTRLPYWFSDTDNKLFVIGCNSMGYAKGVPAMIGCCYSRCDNMRPLNGTCSGAGCCQADVPKNLNYLESSFDNGYNTTDPGRPCSYIFMMEKAAFSFSTTYLTSTVFNDTYKGMSPAVLDWHIGPWSCDVAKRNMSSYACVSRNSECVNSSNQPGYRCKCLEAYEGNPYIIGGCKGTVSCPLGKQMMQGFCVPSCPRGNQMIQGVCVPDQKSPWVIVPVIGASIGFAALVVFLTCGYLIKERRKLQRIRRKYFRQHGGLLLFEEMRTQLQGAASFTIFSEEELQHATHKFHEDHIIGYGGHGTVYKGLLSDGVEVAVKRCKTINENHKKEFGREMLILAQINHRNVVKLLGCCLEVEVPTLVYEFVPDGTLFQLIHGHGSHPMRPIFLGARLQIAYDSAEALAYLHSWASPPILHGDVKSSNILLHAHGGYTAKVSDFGASILAPSDEAQFVTLVQGTYGYLDPEYMQTCQLTDKSDVYSFGVVLAELLTSKKAFNLQAPEHEKTLSIMFLDAIKGGMIEELLDDELKNTHDMEIIEEIAELSRQCLEMSGKNRPSMKEVANKLGQLRKMLMQHPWAKHSSEETESLLGVAVSSYDQSTEFVGSTSNFCIDKEAAMSLEFGR